MKRGPSNQIKTTKRKKKIQKWPIMYIKITKNAIITAIKTVMLKKDTRKVREPPQRKGNIPVLVEGT